MSAQLAAAATNRIVPNGIGGTALNLRYLRRAGISTGAAASVLVALAVVAGLTDLGFVGTVTTVGPHLGLTGAAQEMTALTTAGLAAGRQQSALLLTAFAGLAAFVVVRCRGLGVSRMLAGTADALRQVGDLARHPGRLIAAAVASTASSVAIASGFVVAVHVWGSSSSPLPAGALLAVYLIGSAAGGTAPVPAFFGLTEAALVAGLVFGGYTFASAVLAVAMFRVLTYWMPLPAGLWAARRLRRANLI
jgi:undecaprenyl-diphosphatase